MRIYPNFAVIAGHQQNGRASRYGIANCGQNKDHIERIFGEVFIVQNHSHNAREVIKGVQNPDEAG